MDPEQTVSAILEREAYRSMVQVALSLLSDSYQEIARLNRLVERLRELAAK